MDVSQGLSKSDTVHLLQYVSFYFVFKNPHRLWCTERSPTFSERASVIIYVCDGRQGPLTYGGVESLLKHRESDISAKS